MPIKFYPFKLISVKCERCLSLTENSVTQITQSCPGQQPVSLKAIPYSGQFHSELSRTAASSLRTVTDSGQFHSALSRTAVSDWDNTSLLSSVSTHFHSSFILNGKYSLLIPQEELKKLLL